MKGKKLADILLERMESGKLFRDNYMLPMELKETCAESEVFEMYNKMVKLLIEARGSGLREFDAMIDKALDLWMKIEPSFPVLREENIEWLVRKNVGFVDLRKCIEMAMRIGKYYPIKFSDATDIARRCGSFRKIKDNSMNRVLTRVLRYLESSGLLINTWASGSKGRKVRSMYFRIYRVTNGNGHGCSGCHFIRDIRELLKKIEELYPHMVWGSNSQDGRSQHSEE